MKLYALYELVAAVCPIDGINSNGLIWFKPEATEAQKAQAQQIMDQYLPTLTL